MQAGKDLQVPLLVTEQYPERLGNTVQELDVKHAAAVYPKAFFSMYTPDIQKKIGEIYAANKLESVVLFGIEVCSKYLLLLW